MKQIVLATNNEHKVIELRRILLDIPVHILTLKDFPRIGEIEETGNTLYENSMLKAKTVHKQTGLPAIADDTGLEVDYLDGKPGVFSARYAGINATYEDNVQKLLKSLSGVPENQRTAKFKTVISFITENEELWTQGAIEGLISEKVLGNGGFGYDPVFFVPKLKKTFAELSTEEKNEISHRGLAMRNLKSILKKWLEEYPHNIGSDVSINC